LCCDLYVLDTEDFIYAALNPCSAIGVRRLLCDSSLGSEERRLKGREGAVEAQLPEDQRLWEQSADVSVIEPDVAVAVNLHSLARDFGACIATPLLFGHDFLHRNPGLLADFWRFDDDLFGLRMIGLPIWLPIRSLREAIAARGKIWATAPRQPSHDNGAAYTSVTFSRLRRLASSRAQRTLTWVGGRSPAFNSSGLGRLQPMGKNV
jgi:hypothetical protein